MSEARSKRHTPQPESAPEPEFAGRSACSGRLSALGKAARFAVFLLTAWIVAAALPRFAVPASAAAQPEAARQAAASATPKLDHSGRKRVGKASFYAKRFAGRKMADGQRMKLHGSNAASRTLPLGTVALVTNLETGQCALVSIQDRGPYVKGRIVDLSPATARAIGIDREIGVARVEVAPLVVPQPDGSIKLAATYPAAWNAAC